MGKALPALIVLGGSAGLTYYAYTQGYLNSILIKMGMEKYITCPKGTVWSIEEGKCMKKEEVPSAPPTVDCSKIHTETECWMAGEGVSCKWCKTPTDPTPKCRPVSDYPHACIDCIPAICFKTSDELTEHNEIYHPKQKVPTVIGTPIRYSACGRTKSYGIQMSLNRRRYIQSISGTLNTSGSRDVLIAFPPIKITCFSQIDYYLDNVHLGRSASFACGSAVPFGFAIGKIGRTFAAKVTIWTNACCKGTGTVPDWGRCYIKSGAATFTVGYV